LLATTKRELLQQEEPDEKKYHLEHHRAIMCAAKPVKTGSVTS